jgi:hypothetical protein
MSPLKCVFKKKINKREIIEYVDKIRVFEMKIDSLIAEKLGADVELRKFVELKGLLASKSTNLKHFLN